MAVSDDKQNRLSGLSQDVIAVVKKTSEEGAASAETVRAGANKKTDKPAQHSHASATRSSGQPRSRSVLPSSRAVAEGAKTQPAVASQRALWAAVLLSVVALLIALYVLWGGRPAVVGASVSSTGIAAAIARLDADLQVSTQRIALLEAAMGAMAAGVEEQRDTAVRSGGSPELGMALRGVRLDIERLTKDVAAVTAQGKEATRVVEVASKDSRTALTQVDRLSAQLTTLSGQLQEIQRNNSAAAVSKETAVQLQSLTKKSDMMAADIRQLYRLLESRNP